MTVFESLILMIAFATLVVAILSELEDLTYRPYLAKALVTLMQEKRICSFLIAKKVTTR